MKKWTLFLLSLLVITLGIRPAFSQAAGQPGNAAPENQATTEEPAGTEVTSSGDQEGMVSFDFKDADIRNVLRIFSHKTGINIVAAPEVQGSVTVKLNNVPWEKALKIILEMNNFAYVREENVIKVLTKDRIAQEPLKTEVLALDYAKASAVEATIKGMLTERGTVRVDDRANLLIISDVPSSFDQVKQVIKRLDLPTPQVLIETKMIETNMDMEKNFGVKWDFLSNYTLSLIGDGKNGELLKGTEVSRTITDTTTDTLDYEHQALMNRNSTNPEPIRVQDPTTGETSWQYKVPGDQLHSFNNPNWATKTAGFTKNNVLSNAYSKVTTPFNSTISASSFKLIMSALMTDDGTDILSSPSIVTMDNKQADISVVTDIRLPNYTFSEQTGRYAISGFTVIPAGITLTVTPHVAPNGYITMDLEPTVSARSREVQWASLGVTLPEITRENIKTAIMVKDGDTVVLGGLIKQSDSYTNQKVPLLHSIPVLGWLFKNKDKTLAKRNLLIFVTPNIIKKENSGTITQNKTDEYTKSREADEEPTTIYPVEK